MTIIAKRNNILVALLSLFPACAVSESGHCARTILVSGSRSQSITLTPLDVMDTCLLATPQQDETKIALLIKAPPLIMFAMDGKSLDLKGVSESHCLIATHFRQCRIWQEKIRDICPGQVTLKPFFGPVPISFTAIGNITENITITFKYLHRFDGAIDGDCTKLEAPAVTTTESTPVETTTPYATTVPVETTVDTVVLQTVTATTESPTLLPTTISVSTGYETDDNFTTIAIIALSALLVGAILLTAVIIICHRTSYWRYSQRRHDEENGIRRGRRDEIDDVGFPESTRVLLQPNGNDSTASLQPGGSQEMNVIRK